METSALTAVLGDTWFGATLPVAARARLASVGQLVEVPDGTVLIEEDRPCPAMGILIRGRIALRLRVQGVGDRTIMTLEPGEVFGWSAVLPRAVATSTCVAIAPSVAILFDGVGLMMALELDDTLAAAVYHRLLASVARRLSATRVQLLDVYRAAGEPW
ncbi:MAG TPA: cyclic nucleotide-binding domain-containing protein [Candidatus Limnocylindrales bacterium]